MVDTQVQGERSAFEVLNAALYHDERWNRPFMVMTAYFDESGTHGAASPLITVAGFVASAEQWAAYERELAALLGEYDVKKFHAKEFRDRKGDFKGWTKIRQARFNSIFLRLADDHLGYGLAMVLNSESYKNVYRAYEFPRKVRPDTQYGLCVRYAIVKAMLEIKDRKNDWPLNIVMEDGHKNAGDAVRVFGDLQDKLGAKYSNSLGYISFGSKNNCLPLAIADALAYSIFRMSAGYSKHPTNPDAAVVGPAEPPYYVHKIPMSRTSIDDAALAQLRDYLRI